MIEGNKYKLGLFVLAGLILLLLMLFLFGMSEIFRPKIRFVTLFDESVQGLEIGQPVKLRGVTVGKVSRVKLREKDNKIRVDMEAVLDSIEPESSKTTEFKERFTKDAGYFFSYLRNEMGNGLRCRLEFAGITGMKYVEMDYTERPVGTVEQPPAFEEGILYVPSTPSLYSELRTSVQASLAKIAMIDFKEISDNLNRSLESVDKFMNDPKLSRIIMRLDELSGHLNETARNLEENFSEDDIKEIKKQIEDSLISFRKLSGTLSTEIDKAKLGETSTATRRTMENMEKEIKKTLGKFDKAIDAFTELVRYLEEDPGSLVHGKQKPAIYKGE